MAALLLDEVPSAIVRQWYDNVYAEFMLYWYHYCNFAANWGCCGHCVRIDLNRCGTLPEFTINVNDTLFTDQYVPSGMPYVVDNAGHVGRFDSCDANCSKCCDFRHDTDEFHNMLNKFDKWQNIQFKTNAELKAYISDRVYKLSQSNFRHYVSNIEVLMHNTLKKFYQVLFVSGKHTKAAHRDKLYS
jgi:hypothetical protein